MLENKKASLIALDYIKQYKDIFNALHQAKEVNPFLDTSRFKITLSRLASLYTFWHELSKKEVSQ
jgi:hypothetical protein